MARSPRPDNHQTVSPHDAEWLVSQSAAERLELARSGQDELERTTALRRRGLSAHQATLAAQLIELRSRARVKFAAAEQMFFTRRSLEQATDQHIADYKAQSFASCRQVVDLCCGIGGDSISLARVVPRLLAVDLDPVLCTFANRHLHDSKTGSYEVRCEQAERFNLTDCDGWHIDPDRRPADTRVTAANYMLPDHSALGEMLKSAPDAAIKVAPATPEVTWPVPTRREWIGHRRECQQQIVWTGRFANGSPRQATVLDAQGSPHSLSGTGEERASSVPECGPLVVEPHPAVLAAGLVGALASSHQWHTFTADQAYLTGHTSIPSPLVATFQVIDLLPFRPDSLRRELKRRGISITEVKRRAVHFDLESLRRQLTLTDGSPHTLIVARQGAKAVAIVAQRVAQVSVS
ncbi:MAG: class I SAM-dependent methyltransferase [Pirellulales bacterium]